MRGVNYFALLALLSAALVSPAQASDSYCHWHLVEGKTLQDFLPARAGEIRRFHNTLAAVAAMNTAVTNNFLAQLKSMADLRNYRPHRITLNLIRELNLNGTDGEVDPLVLVIMNAKADVVYPEKPHAAARGSDDFRVVVRPLAPR